ncbi:hypothetical protein V6N11_008329 [Hibiscus sabdariffa]|uniref:Uncharacterized protein n=1 Tax=Hibiscus sabdariffa TaxID=183260 RepID=A0ABR2Q0A9_9ROSI
MNVDGVHSQQHSVWFGCRWFHMESSASLMILLWNACHENEKAHGVIGMLAPSPVITAIIDGVCLRALSMFFIVLQGELWTIMSCQEIIKLHIDDDGGQNLFGTNGVD